MNMYPPQLLAAIKAAWSKGPAQGAQGFGPIPPDDHILVMLEAAFHAGLQTEEGRPLRIRLAYLDPQAPNSRTTPRRLLPFASSVPLNSGALAKLACAVDPRRCAIGVFSRATERPEIWGLVDSGISPWEVARNLGMADQHGGAPAPVSTLEVAVNKPGELVVSSGRSHLCTLTNGQIRASTPLPLACGQLGQFFRGMCDRFRDHLRERQIYRPSYLTNLPLYFVESLVGRTARARHGATLIFVPQGFADDGAARRHELRFKYRLRESDVWGLMRERFNLEHRHFDNLEAAHAAGAVTNADEQVALYLEGEEWRTFGVALEDRAELIAHMTGVDGAVVLDTRLRILGFGAEIRTDDAGTLKDVVLEDPDGTRLPIDGFGTRHRSAFRLCSKDDCIACIVVSSDGPIRGVRRVGADVHFWPSLSV